jgi:hypothetical protein
VTIEYNFYKNIKDINIYAEFEMLKVKVPIIFFGTMGWVFRHAGIDVKKVSKSHRCIEL